MNYLAHALLARADDQLLIGSLIADIKPRPKSLSRRVEQGIRLHHRVDGFADRDENFHKIRAELRPAAGLYAGVAADICCDNLLSRNWDRYCELRLEKFTAHVYGVMRRASASLPLPFLDQASRGDVDWLAGYRHRAGLLRALERVRGRVSSTRRFPDINGVLDLFFAEREMLSEIFVQFFDELMSEVGVIKEF